MELTWSELDSNIIRVRFMISIEEDLHLVSQVSTRVTGSRVLMALVAAAWYSNMAAECLAALRKKTFESTRRLH